MIVFWQLYFTINLEEIFCFDNKKMSYLCGIWRFANAYYKETEKGVAAMCKVMEDMIYDYVTEAEKETKKASAVRLLKQGKLSKEEIAEGVGLTIEEVDALAQE